jgi:Na+/H+ antiporter NhaD/arsenite permease-like protein
MFITVDGFNRTGIPNALWELVEPHSRIDSAKGTALLAVVILVLSNVASNVPTGIALDTLLITLNLLFSFQMLLLNI